MSFDLASSARTTTAVSVKASGAGDLQSALTRAVERVLDYSPIALDDDLFDMGCDSIKALAIALEIEMLTGQSISPTMIYDSPTVSGLATCLTSTCRVGRGGLVLLKMGDPTQPPVFIAPGLGSTVSQLRGLAGALTIPNQIYGLEPQGLSEETAPLDQIETIAADFAAQILALRPDGRCHLAGFCYGGVIALEVVRTLLMTPALPPRTDANLLVMINTYPHSHYWPVASRVATWAHLLTSLSPRSLMDRLLRHHLPALRKLPPGKALTQSLLITARAATVPLRIFALSAYIREKGSVLPHAVSLQLPPAMQRVKEAAAVAFRAYVPRAYGGPTLLVTSSSAMRLPFDPAGFWKRRMPGIHLRQVRGDYAELLGDNLADVAALVSDFITRADTQFQR